MSLVTNERARAALEVLERLGPEGPVRTPLLPVPESGRERPLLLKPESLQPTGAFKIRGALHAAAVLDERVRARGLVAYSSGNHARAVAHAGKVFGVPATVVVPHTAPAAKVAAARSLGAEIVPVEVSERESRAEEIAESRGASLIPPFDAPAVIAGQATVGLEIAEDVDAFGLSEVTVLVPISGGGLISGVAVGLARCRARVRVVGVEPELAADTREGFRAGERRDWPVEARTRTRADGLTAQPSELTFAHIRELVDDVVTVSEAEIGEAVGFLAESCRLVAEPSGAVTTAAHRHRTRELGAAPTVAVVSGGNVDRAELLSSVAG
ncbi:threonine/serine dehydratase [Actinopolyspora erythraea]|uniref:threonine ammonia-lyase n=1 Tax=Actinopolyspora erythraea TaxID=414996 RepID=A0A099D293_9ACTN|nr:threonine/serine dehydratase [Actinopolyspora erythraea]ASU77330.1 threonine/serine dehydratase [Actinopolyspora erythraea]KGI80179.1 threonine dehydratase [Actinopolyspora erythraea]